MEKLTQEELKRQLHYDPDSGIFTWLVSNNRRVKIGDIAGTKKLNGYIQIGINKKIYEAHRLAWFYTHGYFPENDIDHINRIRDDNRIKNLREASRQCNVRNSGIGTNNISGIVGVYWRKQRNKWQSQIKVNNKNIYLGIFTSKLEAVKTRWEAEVKYEFPNCNTISTAYLYLKERNIL